MKKQLLVSKIPRAFFIQGCGICGRGRAKDLENKSVMLYLKVITLNIIRFNK